MTDRGEYPRHYILVGRTPIATDLLTWARWIDEWENRSVLHTVVDADLGVTVSTIFLGLDHSFGFGLEPILFETMGFAACEKIILGKMYYREAVAERRYCTMAQAEAGHAEVVAEMTAWVDGVRAETAALMPVGVKS